MSTNAIKTTTAREKFASGYNSGGLPAITEVAFGDGGHNTDTGEPIPPDGSETTVPGQVIQKSINSSSISSTTYTAVGIIDDTEISLGTNVSAVGFYDSEGDLVALKTFSPKGMTENMTIEVTWNDQF